jgi:predicted ATPase
MPAQLLRRHFAAELHRRGYRADPAQQQVLECLADWLQAQLAARSYWSRSPTAGIYLCSGVGRGKSFIMDCLFQAAPFQAKRRVHVHAFNRRRIALRGLSASALWVDFAELFVQPTAVADYLWLCEHFQHLAISATQPLGHYSLEVQQRSINFVDIAYDAGIQPFLSGERSLAGLCAEPLPLDFARTRSRCRLLQLCASSEAEGVASPERTNPEIATC